MDSLQFIYPYYENPQMLEKQLRTWEEYPRELKKNLEIILVDDGSPRNPAQPLLRDVGVNIRAFRIKENIPWNQNGAHNLGFHVARDGWCLTTDIDHVVAADQLRIIYGLQVNTKNYYRFGRRQPSALTTPFKPHPNTWLLTRSLFWLSGGYDEDFSGYYGSDSCFRRALESVARGMEIDPPYMIVYDEKDIPDANTQEWGRKGSEYYSVNFPHLRKKRGMTYRAKNPLRFSWEQTSKDSV